jgi:hypothetical protein
MKTKTVAAQEKKEGKEKMEWWSHNHFATAPYSFHRVFPRQEE